jgi:hypothetical protein
MDIIDISGKLVKQFGNISAIGKQQLTVSDLSEGVYLLQIKEDNKLIGTQRFLKAK